MTMLSALRFAPIVVVAVLSVGCQSEDGPLLKTEIATGKIEGVADGEVAVYLGIPYAAPPVGDMRWRPPSPAESWSGVRQADSFGANCVQKPFPNGVAEGKPWTKEYNVDPQSAFSEDCVYVNIWTPAKSTNERLPVFFWIHGGGFNSGSGSVPIYDGAALASRGIVVVNINYRLGAFGFLAHPELSSESPESSSGNYAIEDMIAALGWVRDNISAFGGDANQVTIAGQSAGAGAVHSLIASPGARGLFARAIAQSGSGARRSSTTLAKAEAAGLKFMAAAGAGSVTELRALPPDKLLAVELKGVRFGPIVDGAVIPVSPAEAEATGAYNDTPILTGYTADESSSWIPHYGRATVTEYEESIQRVYGDLKDELLQLYAAPDDQTAGEMSKSIARDRTAAAMYQWAADRLRTSKNPIYCYWYTHPEPGPESARWGAFHASELAYVFETLDKSPNRAFTEQDRAIAKTIADYWSNFIKTGDPNGPGLTEWPALDVTGKQIMELGEAFRARPILSPEKLKLFEAYAKRGR